MHRFVFCWIGAVTTAAISPLLGCAALADRAPARPNVILVITDDQGYGDVGVHGNEMIQTPNLDQLHAQSVRLTNFHVDPTCSPTRSALMSGRYSTRTGVWHTIMGRSLMSDRELTMAEAFKSAGYDTSMYGKWHLGDNHPCRPQDQGFDEVFYHGGGGVTQTPDYFGNDYFDDTYFRATAKRSGVPEKVTGYCTDVWFDNALAFMEKKAKAKRPFFIYLSTNAPHGPFNVAEKYSKPYVERGVPGTMAKFYGMITNIDENMGRLTAKLESLEVAENTILVFMTDNGTAAGVARGPHGGNQPAARVPWRGFNDGMRGQKGSEYDGGHRVPFFIRWPGGGIGGRDRGGHDIDYLSAHIDVLPTLADLCGFRKPPGPVIDGMSLAPYLLRQEIALPKRTLFVHSQRVEHPQKWRKSSVMTQKWRLVNGKELYDIHADRSQARNVAADHPDVVTRLSRAYEKWWESLSTGFDDDVEIGLGNEAENPARLTCHDWHTDDKTVPWNQGHIRGGTVANGYWAVNVERAGTYEITLRRWPEQLNQSIEATEARVKIANVDESTAVPKSDSNVPTSEQVFRVKLPAGSTRLQTWLTMPNGKTRGAYFVDVTYVGK